MRRRTPCGIIIEAAVMFEMCETHTGYVCIASPERHLRGLHRRSYVGNLVVSQ